MKQLPDQDIEAEQAVLGALLVDTEALDRAPDVEPAWFFLVAHQHVMSAIRKLTLERRPVDAVTVHSLLADAGKIPEQVPADLVFALAKGLGCAGNVAYYAGEVRRLWALRQARALAREFASNVDIVDPAAAIACLQRDLGAIECGKASARSMLQLTADYMAELQRDAADPNTRISFDTGYTLYDRHTGGLRPGVLTIWAGRPGKGKTSFVMGVMAHLARSGVPCAGFWLEDDWRDACRRYHQTRNWVPAQALRGSPLDALRAMNAVATNTMAEQERIFIDDSHGLTSTEMGARMRKLVREHGVRVFFCDHVGEIRLEREERWGDRHDLAIGRAARAYRDVAKELGAVPVLVSQMNRNQEHRNDPAPRMSDLDGSGQVEQAARVIAFCSQPTNGNGEPTGEFLVDLAKNTNGKPGLIRLRWVAERMAVENG